MKNSTNIKSFFILIIMLIFISSCNHRTIKGSGNVSSQIRTVSEFKRVEVSSALTVIYTEGSDYKVEVIADDNLIPYIETEIHGDELQIGIQERKSFKNVTKTEIHITSPALKGVEASGASSFSASNTIHSTEFKLQLSGASKANFQMESISAFNAELSGSSDATIQGLSNSGVLAASGASVYHMEDFELNSATVDFSGASSGAIKVVNSLNATLSGASKLIYYGNPGLTNVNTSGSSSIIKK